MWNGCITGQAITLHPASLMMTSPYHPKDKGSALDDS